MREVILDQKSLIVSETDRRGLIRYINDEFCTVSGYKTKELIGKPHNIVRHPDMPKAIFNDLWKSVKAGEIWKGFIKNSTKDGGYYWVFATVFPISSVIGEGYLSVRTKANKDEVEKYEGIYKELRMKEKQ